MEHNPNPNPNPNYVPDSDEAEERLSFCDFPMYSDAADWENLCTQDQTSYSSSKQDYFEFFSDEWNTTTEAATTYPPRNIIFCGKLIPYKESVSCDKSRELEENRQQKHEKRGLFRWNSSSFTKPKTSKSGKSDDKCGFKVQKVKLVTSPSKSRWYLFMFGLARFPTEMELKDLKRRRNRQAGATLFRSDGGGDKSREKGWWGLVRALGCGSGGQYTDAVVKASLGGKL
ncbi:uncharacterized protein LOC132269961 [Cornus florida]|uniref:uncharacterized protein LOC132269961 n=1 Tax=Cornus florida TaxID=4283 RepID=UPI002896B184|nr:uncharacterized protein LOC132269961 [Cornus florida]